MKRNLVLASLFALFALATAASAQKATDFTGTWTLDVAKSSPAETMIESQSITVTQTAADVKIERNTKMKAMPDGQMGGGGRGFGGGQGPTTYGITAPVKSQRQTPNGSIDVSTSAKIEGNKMSLSSSFTTPQGDRTMTETWTMNADGSVTVESQGRGGAVSRTYKKS